MIAAIPRPTCQTCDGTFDPGEEAVPSDWTVFDGNLGARTARLLRHVSCAQGIAS